MELDQLPTTSGHIKSKQQTFTLSSIFLTWMTIYQFKVDLGFTFHPIM